MARLERSTIESIILDNLTLSYDDLSKMTGIKERQLRKIKRSLGIPPARPSAVQPTQPEKTVEEQVTEDLALNRMSRSKRETDAKLKQVYLQYEALQQELESALQVQGTLQTYEIKKKTKSTKVESTAFLICSDWHIEQRIDSRTVSGLNEFNPTIGKDRVEKLFRKTVDFIEMYQQDTTINTLVLALLGDFINGNIHEELIESNYMSPIEATIYVQNLIASGIEYILSNSSVNLVVPCHSGNHPRITRKIHHGTEKGNSLESLVYYYLQQYFRNEPRVTFIIADGYHSYLTIYGRTIRFHHGHNVKFGGGIGGLFIPAYKAISQWDKARPAELDVFGHFHQTKDGGKFLCNGSLVGYDTFALSIKADYEPPKQSFFLYHEELGRTINSPIIL